MAGLHIGKKIKEMVDKSHFTITDFAKSINLTRDGAYKIFAKENIDTSQLRQICKVLNHDFFAYYSKDVPVTKEPKDAYGYATKDELNALTNVVQTLVQEIEKLRESLPQPKTKTKKAPRKK
ncbi:MAG: hypothetical protein K0S32_1582 [Bacteroidetes bacterium]|jgi:hypothetical protein|nr:hypothetical protein [Bacteroidota bacterium]